MAGRYGKNFSDARPLWVDAADWAKAFGHGDNAEGWAKRIGGLAVGRDTKVVVYDEGG